MGSECVVVLVTGVPGTGKSTISSLLASELNGSHIDLSRLVKEGGLSIGWDHSRATMIADINALRKTITNILDVSSSPVIIDGHYSPEVVAYNRVTLVIVLRRAPWILRTELTMRGYRPRKVRENVEAELLGSCLVDALDMQDHAKVCEINTTGLTPQETVKLVLAVLNGKVACGYGGVDWMNQPEAETMLRGL